MARHICGVALCGRQPNTPLKYAWLFFSQTRKGVRSPYLFTSLAIGNQQLCAFRSPLERMILKTQD
jgi:hypothetical protein